MLNNIRADFRRYAGDELTARGVFYAIFDVALWAIATFRVGKWIQGLRLGLVRKPLMVLYFFLYKFVEILTGIRISVDSEIGPGLQIHNFGGIVIHGRLGSGCTIVQGAQIVSRGNFKGQGWPTLGDNVYLGSGAKVLGAVTIGNNVRIGANAVVKDDVPDDSVVLPPESRVIVGYYRDKKNESA
ncbi:serine acetyltransferase [bacterium]|nr:serine acetyltransferase [bacterium]